MALAVSAGALMALQAPTNAVLGTLIGPIETSLVSFSVGLALILTITLVKSRGRIVLLRGAAPWQCLVLAAARACGIAVWKARLALGVCAVRVSGHAPRVYRLAFQIAQLLGVSYMSTCETGSPSARRRSAK